MYHHFKPITIIQIKFDILVLGLGLGHMVMTMYHHMKSIPIIHTRFNILVLGLGQGLMLFQWWPCTIISNQFLSSILNSVYWYWVLVRVIWWWPCTMIWNQSLSSILYSTYWYWVLAWVICCLSDDHVPSYEINTWYISSILNLTYWYWVLARALCCFMMIDHAPSYHSIPPYSSRILVLGIGLSHVLFHDDWPCNITSSSILNI